MEWQMRILELCLIAIIVFGILIVVYFVGKLAVQSKKLKTSEQYYQSLYDHNPDMILTIDLKGNLLSANSVVESYIP
jgi:PAS domain-containing protein